MNRRLKILYGFFLIFLIIPSLALAQTVGKFTYVEGRVDVLRPPAIRAIPVKIGDTVFVSDIIRAKSKSKAEITFINDNILRVAENTRVEISEYMFEEEKSSGVVKLSRGKVQAIVPEKIAKRIATFGEANRFEVHTPTAVAGVRGTDFFTFHQREVTGVLVKEGNVEVHNPKFPEVVVTVTAGNITIVPENKPPTPPRPATDAEIKGHEKDTVPAEKEKAEKEKAEKEAKEKLEKEKAEKEKADKEVEEKKKAEAEAKAKAEAEKEAEAKAKAEAEAKAAGEARAKAEAEAKAKAEAVAKAEAEAKAATEAVKKVEAAAAAAEAEKARPVEIVARERAAVGEVVVAPVPPPAPVVAPPVLPVVITEPPTKATEIVTPPPITEAVIKDTTPPVVTITSKPASLTNSSTAGFGFSSTETSTYSYRLDGGLWTTTTEGLNLSSLTEGSHTLDVKATDAAGNISLSVSYTWTTDYTAPVITIKASPESGTNLTTVSLSSNESVTYSYKLDGVSGTGVSLSLSGLTEGSHTFDYTATDPAGNTTSGSLTFSLSRYTLTGSVSGDLTGSVTGGDVAGVSGKNWGGWRIDMSGSYTTIPSTFTTYAGGRSSDTVLTNNEGYWLETINGTSLNGILSGTSSLKYLSYDRLGTGTGSVSGSYGAGTWSATDLGLGTYTERPLNFVSDINTNNLSGLLGGTQPIWIATGQNPAPINLMGRISVRKGMLDIHAADIGHNSGQWTTLLLGGVTHVNQYLDQNYIVDINHVDINHPVVSDLDSSDYYNWYYVSHGYFTNLYTGTNIILKDTNNNPTTIEYLFGNTKVLATMQTLEWTYKNNLAQNGLPLKNTLAYVLRQAGITPNQGKLLLLKDIDPWGTTAIQTILTGWNISYDIRSSSDFAVLDLSPYSAIVIASDQTNSFYSNIASQISRLESFTAPGFTPTFISEIYSYNKGNSTYTTYDGGAYRGYIGGIEINNTLNGRMYSIYIDPSGNAGFLKGSFTGNPYSDIGMWEAEGSIYPIQIVSNIGITPQNLYTGIEAVEGDFEFEYKYGNVGSGTFTAGGGLSSNYIAIEGTNILNYNEWGIWNATSSGTYTGSTSDTWSFSTTPLDFKPTFILNAETEGTQWSNNRLTGSTRGYYGDIRGAPETGVFVGETLGTFNPTAYTWQAISMGVWLETNKFLEMAGKVGNNPNIAALQALNIPCVEVGRATLTQNTSNPYLSNVAMNDVIFFALSTGGAPKIWATGNVSGGYTGTPSSAVVPLSGDGLNANFNVQQWDTTNNKWLSTVSNGAGTYSGTGTMNGSVIDFHGAAAGTINTAPVGATPGTFSGTGAGVVK